MDSIVKMGFRQPGEEQQETGSATKRAVRGTPEPLTELYQDPRFLQTGPAADSRQGIRKTDPQRQTDVSAGKAKAGPDAQAEKAEKERLSLQEKERQQALSRRCRLIAGYVVATVVISYILLRVTDNLGGILTALGNTVRMIGMLLQPLFWGFVLAYILSPLADLCERRISGLKFLNKGGKRRTYAVLITCAGVLLVVLALLSIVASAVSRSLRVASLEDLIDMAQSLAGTLGSFQQTLMNRLSALNISSSDAGAAFKQIGEKLAQFTGGLSTSLISSVGQIGGFLTNLLFAIIFCIYFLLDCKGLVRYWDRVLLAVCGRKARRKFHILAGDADAVFSGYIRGQLIDALIMSVLVSASLALIGIRYAVIIGVLSGIGNLIPYVGPVVAYGSTIIVCLLAGDFRRLLFALVVLFVIQTVDGNIINPRLLSSTVDVHPMLVIAALIIGGSVGGLVGMLFAVPVAAFLRIQFDKIVDHLLKVHAPEKKPGAAGKRAARTGPEKETGSGKKADAEKGAGSGKKTDAEKEAGADGTKKTVSKKEAGTGGTRKKTASKKGTDTRGTKKTAPEKETGNGKKAAPKKAAGKTAGTGKKKQTRARESQQNRDL